MASPVKAVLPLNCRSNKLKVYKINSKNIELKASTLASNNHSPLTLTK